MWYLTVTLGRGRTTGGIIPQENVAEVRAWIENYHKLKDHIEKISEINRELLRRERAKQRLADCVGKDIGVGVAIQTGRVIDSHATEHQRSARRQRVHVVSDPDPHAATR